MTSLLTFSHRVDSVESLTDSSGPVVGSLGDFQSFFGSDSSDN